MRSFSREAIRDERGYVLISVLILAVLYLGLMELMLRESSDAFRSATRFRSRIVSQSLAEDGVELAARRIVERDSAKVKYDTADGKVDATMKRTGEESFEIASSATSAGVSSSSAMVKVIGHISGKQIYVDRTIHSQ